MSRIDTVRDGRRTATREYSSCIGVYRLLASGRERAGTDHRVCGRRSMIRLIEIVAVELAMTIVFRYGDKKSSL